MSCVHCGKEIDEKYIIDAKGLYYCSEEEMEDYLIKHDISIEPHPYEDRYLLLRHEYISLLESWRQILSTATTYLEDTVEELVEEIDELIADYADFIHTEGDDGHYAWEIYQYTIKLRRLQEQILLWRPDRTMYYWVTSECEINNGIKEEKLYSDMFTDILTNCEDDYILYVMEHHRHPYREGLNYVFESLDLAEVCCEVLQPFCDKYNVELFIIEAYKCEGFCGEILETDADTTINGWFYCYNCKESGDYGIFTQQELEYELEYYEEHEEERQVVIYEQRDWCHPYKRKIKRTCRALMVEVPAWAY